MLNSTFDNDPNSDDLTRRVMSGDIVVFVGSGLSCSRNLYPAWWELIKTLQDELNITEYPPVDKDTCAEDLMKIADIAAINDEQAYTSVLRNKFAFTFTNIPRNYQLLMDLRVQSFVTTNFDPLLANSFKHARHKDPLIYPDIKITKLGSGGCQYLHGLIDEETPVDISNVILRKSQFTTLYNKETGLLFDFWKSMLTDCDILFLGCTLRERDLQLPFELSRIIAKNTSRKENKRYILIEKSEVEQILAEEIPTNKRAENVVTSEFYQSYGVTPVQYSKESPDYVGLTNILKSWSSLASNQPIGFKDRPEI